MNVEIITLPVVSTEKCLVERFNKLIYRPIFFEKDLFNDKQIKLFHLYVVTADKIEENDIIYHKFDKYVTRYLPGFGDRPDGYLKVIASTNTTLGLPMLSEEFIDFFIENYGKNILITNIVVEDIKQLCT